MNFIEFLRSKKIYNSKKLFVGEIVKINRMEYPKIGEREYFYKIQDPFVILKRKDYKNYVRLSNNQKFKDMDHVFNLDNENSSYCVFNIEPFNKFFEDYFYEHGKSNVNISFKDIVKLEKYISEQLTECHMKKRSKQENGKDELKGNNKTETEQQTNDEAEEKTL